VKMGGGYLYRDLCYMIPEMLVPAHYIRGIFRIAGHLSRLECTNCLLIHLNTNSGPGKRVVK